MNQLLAYTNKAEEKAKKVWIIAVISVILVIVCISTIFAATNKNSDKILKNVYINGVHVGTKTKEEAYDIISRMVQSYETNNITLSIDGEKYVIMPDDVGFQADGVDEAIESAYQYGRDKSFIENNYTILLSNFKNKKIELAYSLDQEKMDEILARISASSETLVLDDSYSISGDQIVIFKGQDGLKIDEETLKTYVLAAINNNVSNVDIPVIESESKKIDMNQLYAEIYVEPKNASFVSGDNFEVIVDEPGVDFDLDEAKSKYAEMDDSGEMVIELRKIAPVVTLADLDKELFKDTLASIQIVHSASETKNIANSCKKLNEVIVYPGKEFSYNEIIKNKTAEDSYLSTALYNLALKTDMEVTERNAHEKLVSFVKPSLDADVSSESLDFKFKNTRNYPIKIEVATANHILKMSVIGLKENSDQVIELESKVIKELDYTLVEETDSTMEIGNTKVIQEPANGCISEAYKIVKNASGDIVSEKLITKDTYSATDKIVKVGTKAKQVTEVVTPEPDVEPIAEPIAEPAAGPAAEPEVKPVVEKPQRKVPNGWDSPESPYKD